MKKRAEKSWQVFRESLEHLAFGSSTGSKIAEFEDWEPAVIARGQGCRVWDLDGNEYIDYRNGLGPVTLGYCVREINAAIGEQLNRGAVFGYPHELEGKVAARLAGHIPCAEKMRFLKTGGEAIAATIKIARHATGRNRVAHCGYNGWLNSLSAGGYRPSGVASSAPEKGVPPAVTALHDQLPWADAGPWEDLFRRAGDEIAAVVIAPDYGRMALGKEFLPAIRSLTEKHGTLMIMDEIVTGFRVAMGGAQEYFGFHPDMAVFSKGIANGMPLSVYAGRAQLIEKAREVGISSTFGGEALSLAAAAATIEFYECNGVIGHLWETGRMLQEGINRLFRDNSIDAELVGLPPCPVFRFGNPAEQKDFFRRCLGQGVSFYNVPYVNYSHGEKDIRETLEAVGRVLAGR